MIVDNASTDNTREIADELKSKAVMSWCTNPYPQTEALAVAEMSALTLPRVNIFTFWMMMPKFQRNAELLFCQVA